MAGCLILAAEITLQRCCGLPVGRFPLWIFVIEGCLVPKQESRELCCGMRKFLRLNGGVDNRTRTIGGFSRAPAPLPSATRYLAPLVPISLAPASPLPSLQS